MARTIVAQAVELALIHAAVCRAHQQQLACSTCHDLASRVSRKA